MKLSDIWCSLQDQTILMAKINQIMINLQKYIKILAFPDSLAESMIPPGEAPMTDTERLQRTAGQKISNEDNNATIIDAINFPDFSKLKMEYLGFCGWKLLATEGGLLPGNPNLGIATDHEHDFRVFVEGSGRGVRGNTGEVVGSGGAGGG
jgi:hypothetical protein